ncbi:MmcQ/YjbR family DNA-binding protein [Rhizobium sp. TH2]|uniref:MmcQ/YjbR family DNA-binding protein n=1 Tax=Rhizobium sp. TH2 TaxID=2775403 RepID=UPI00215743FF|nr:MmcQ/YjbR family DNA-binding protein [Rhizobium sp. TH2]UVC10331.1 MmcQ/YjbR family DNA-binding protein [Rhizobium sp. TH2]
MTHDDITTIALTLPGVTESAHFGKRDFRAPKIFMSLPTETTANLNLKPDQQLMLQGLYPLEFSALPNKWGSRGWTMLHLDRCNKTTAEMAVEMAWRNVAPKKLLAQKP